MSEEIRSAIYVVLQKQLHEQRQINSALPDSTFLALYKYRRFITFHNI